MSTNLPPTPAPSLGVPRAMALPMVCRGALTGWPQLMGAVTELASEPGLGSAGGDVGGPGRLAAALAIDPQLLQRATPPADLYGRTAWVIVGAYRAVRTVRATLRALPQVLAARADLGPEGRGALVSEAIGGDDGLKGVADRMAKVAGDFAQSIAATWGDESEALGAVQSLSQSLGAGAAARLSTIVAEPVYAQAATRAVVESFHADLASIEAAAARAAAHAVVSNLRQAMAAQAAGWQALGAQWMAVAAVEPAQLGDPAYLSGTLQLDASVTQWGEFGDAIAAYIQRLPVVRPGTPR